MPTTMSEVRAVLDPEEPDYETATRLGADALPFLAELMRGADVLLAAKAAYLTGRIGGPGAVPILRMASAHADSSVRVAAAGAASRLTPEGAGEVLSGLLTDRDSGVRRVAVKSAAEQAVGVGGAELRTRLESVSRADPDPTVRALARKLLAPR